MTRPLLLTLVLSCVGCAATESAPPMTPLAELPDRNREVVEIYARGGAEWRAERARVLEDPSLARFLSENLSIALVEAYGGSQFAGRAEGRVSFERARSELALLAPHSIQTLIAMIEVGDDIVAYLAGGVLVEIGPDAALPLAELLSSENWKTRRRAAEFLGKLPHAGSVESQVVAELARRLSEDEAWIVRAECAGALGHRGARLGDPRAARDPLQRALGDTDPAVTEQAANALGRIADPRAIPALLNYLERATQGARLESVAAGRDALLALSGLKVRWTEMGERNDRTPQEWRTWWKEHRESLVGGGDRP